MPARPMPPTQPTRKVCSLVEMDLGLLQLVSTLVGHGGMQVARSAAQHTFHDCHKVSGFDLIVHHTDLGTAPALPVLEAVGQGQALQERTWQSGPPSCPLSPRQHPRSSLSLLHSQRLE